MNGDTTHRSSYMLSESFTPRYIRAQQIISKEGLQLTQWFWFFNSLSGWLQIRVAAGSLLVGGMVGIQVFDVVKHSLRCLNVKSNKPNTIHPSNDFKVDWILWYPKNLFGEIFGGGMLFATINISPTNIFPTLRYVSRLF